MTLRKGLTRQSGVSNAKLIIKPPHMQVELKPGTWPDIRKMHQTIRDAGYQPVTEKTDLVVTGKLVRVGEGYVLELDGMPAPLTLAVSVRENAPETEARLAAQVGQTVELSGTWRPPADGQGPGSLSLPGTFDQPAKPAKP